MSDFEGKGILFLQLVVLLKMKKEKKKNMDRGIFRKREEKGAFNSLIQKLKLANREPFSR